MVDVVREDTMGIYSDDRTGVYSILCVPLKKLYFGKSIRSINNRISWHRAQLKNHKHNNFDLQADYDLYGPENFKYSVEFETDNEQEAITEEQNLIASWECYNKFFNDDADWSSRNSAISYGHSIVRATPEWKEMQSELTRKQHTEGRFK
jgi:hypothetical protein